MASIGETVSHYRILEKLGEGGMGVVYKAEDLRLRRFVALKFLPENLGEDDVALQRFDAEARAASALDHPNICSIYDIGQGTDGRHFLALAYCEGETLANRMAHGPVAAEEGVDIATQIAEGLSEAHSKGVIHRDIKPQNIMIRPDALVKILDFGVAKLEGEGDITKTATTVGSPAYMSPEQIKGGEISPQSDIWSLGVVLYELLSGHRAFGGGGISTVMYAVLHNEPPSLGNLRPELGQGICRAVERALAKDPRLRFRSAQEMVDALRGLESPTSSSTPPLPFSPPRDSPLDSEPTAPTLAVDGGRPSIAVLPFADLSRQKDQDWFCDGLAEELITALSQIDGLRTASRASTAQFRDDATEPQTMGRKLRVDNLLQGSVRKAGDQLRITTQLIRVGDGSILASNRFDREMKDIFALQEDIALHVVETLKVHFAHSPELPSVEPQTESVTAYNLYLKGRHALNLRTPDSISSGIHFFNEALHRDPAYALAYAGLADAELAQGVYAFRPERDAMTAAKKYSQEALERSPLQVEARTTLGSTLCYSDWDWEGAEREFQRAIRDDPRNPQARHFYAINLLAPTGHFDEALGQYEKALDTDPVSLPINVGKGIVLLLARRFEQCLEQLQATLAIDASFSLTHRTLAEALIEVGDVQQAIAHAKEGDLSQSEPAAVLAATLARAGQRDQAVEILAKLEAAETAISPYLITVVHLALGETEVALGHLERAAEVRSPQLIWIGHRPSFDPVRDEPRFQQLLATMRLS